MKPSGLFYAEDIITQVEEEWLLAHLQCLNFTPSTIRGKKTKRMMVHYGFNYLPQQRNLTIAPESIPDWIMPLRERCANLLGEKEDDFVQSIVTCYGRYDAGIGPHIDAPCFGPVIFGVSLGREVEMVFTHPVEGSYNQRLSPRSLYAMRDAARYVWKHQIKTINPPRYSIVFRSLDGSHKPIEV